MEMGIPSHEVSRRGVGDHCDTLDLPAGGQKLRLLQIGANYSASCYVSLLNFPGPGGTVTLLDVLVYDRRMLRSAAGYERPGSRPPGISWGRQMVTSIPFLFKEYGFLTCGETT